MDLGIDSDELASCVSCGLCLPHCPTFRITGEEVYSPRGRIDAMRSVQLDGAPVDREVIDFMNTCVQCRGCEAACPSGVPFGRMMEHTRTHLAEAGHGPSWYVRAGYRLLRHPRVVGAGSRVLALAQRARLVPRRVGLPQIDLRSGPAVAPTAEPSDAEAWLFTGCVMDAWMRSTHRATAAVLDALGVRYAVSGPAAGCCGALHIHAGLHDDARAMARQVTAAMPGSAPVVVNSAGCGAALKEYGPLLEPGSDFPQRVRDINEFIAERMESLRIAARRERPVIIQDPCHLRHVQRAHAATRTVIGAVAEVVELDDDGLCCGAGGAYAALQPEFAGSIRARKLEVIAAAAARSGADVVVSSNPGCIGHLERDLRELGLSIKHPIDLLAESLG